MMYILILMGTTRITALMPLVKLCSFECCPCLCRANVWMERVCVRACVCFSWCVWCAWRVCAWASLRQVTDGLLGLHDDSFYVTPLIGLSLG